MVQLTIFQHWFRQWLGADQATSHYLNQWRLDYRRIYVALGLKELRSISHKLTVPYESSHLFLFSTELSFVSHLTTIIQSICIFVCRELAVCVSIINRPKKCNHRHQLLQPSSVLKIKMMQPSSRPHFSLAIIISYGNEITPAKHKDNLEMKV